MRECRCGHEHRAHEHYRANLSTPCSIRLSEEAGDDAVYCPCTRYRPWRRWRLW
jgi:hypothetical protein